MLFPLLELRHTFQLKDVLIPIEISSSAHQILGHQICDHNWGRLREIKCVVNLIVLLFSSGNVLVSQRARLSGSFSSSLSISLLGSTFICSTMSPQIRFTLLKGPTNDLCIHSTPDLKLHKCFPLPDSTNRSSQV